MQVCCNPRERQGVLALPPRTLECREWPHHDNFGAENGAENPRDKPARDGRYCGRRPAIVGVLVLIVAALGARPVINAIWLARRARECCYQIDDKGDCTISPSDIVDGQPPSHLSEELISFNPLL